MIDITFQLFFFTGWITLQSEMHFSRGKTEKSEKVTGYSVAGSGIQCLQTGKTTVYYTGKDSTRFLDKQKTKTEKTV